MMTEATVNETVYDNKYFLGKNSYSWINDDFRAWKKTQRTFR